MPLYNFRCGACGATRELMVDFHKSRALELVCVNCGGEMRVAPVLAVNVLKGAKTNDPASSATLAAKSCGHKYHCRCHIKLNRPNPFAKKIRAAHGVEDED
jgi:putative FmdB family regulatory protein